MGRGRIKSVGEWLEYEYLNEPDASVSENDIVFSAEELIEGDSIDVIVLVQNTTEFAITDAISVGLYDGDPAGGGEQINGDQVLSSGIAAGGIAKVQFQDVRFPLGTEGLHGIYALVTTDVSENPANNIASRELIVKDSDLEGPSLFSWSVEESQANGNKIVEPGERARIAYQLTDPSGIKATELSVDGTVLPLSFSAGTYSISESSKSKWNMEGCCP